MDNFSERGNTLLISHLGECHLVDHNRQTIRWSYAMKPFKYEAFQYPTAREYVDVEMDEDGNLYFFHHKGSSKEIINKSDTQMKKYLQTEFGDELNYKRCQDIVNLDVEYGKDVNRNVNLVRITRVRYMMTTCHWQLNVSKFSASFVGSSPDDSARVYVFHTLNLESYINVCENMSTYTFSDGSSMKDVTLHLQLDMKKIKLDIHPEKIFDGHDNLVVGTFNRLPAIIEVLDSNSGIFATHNGIIQSNIGNHNNILRFYGVEMDTNGNYQFAYERCSLRIPDYLGWGQNNISVGENNISELNETWLNFFRGLVLGMDHIHQQGFYYGNMNPWNVLLTEDYVPKLWRFGACKMLTPALKVSDHMDLANLIEYCFSPPLYNIPERQYKIRNFDSSYMHYMAKEAEDVVSILRSTSQQNIMHRILVHPWLWDADKRLQFLKRVNELILNQYYHIDTNKIDGLCNECWDVTKGGWEMNFPHVLLMHMSKNKQYPTTQYDNKKVCGLIKFMRNIHSHHLEITWHLQQRFGFSYLGTTIEDLELVFRTAFPNLLTCVYDELRNQQLPELASFY